MCGSTNTVMTAVSAMLSLLVEFVVELAVKPMFKTVPLTESVAIVASGPYNMACRPNFLCASKLGLKVAMRTRLRTPVVAHSGKS